LDRGYAVNFRGFSRHLGEQASGDALSLPKWHHARRRESEKEGDVASTGGYPQIANFTVRDVLALPSKP
jgi:hypothetical protein